MFGAKLQHQTAEDLFSVACSITDTMRRHHMGVLLSAAVQCHAQASVVLHKGNVWSGLVGRVSLVVRGPRASLNYTRLPCSCWK